MMCKNAVAKIQSDSRQGSSLLHSRDGGVHGTRGGAHGSPDDAHSDALGYTRRLCSRCTLWYTRSTRLAFRCYEPHLIANKAFGVVFRPHITLHYDPGLYKT
jgi:hypothetical protein